MRIDPRRLTHLVKDKSDEIKFCRDLSLPSNLLLAAAAAGASALSSFEQNFEVNLDRDAQPQDHQSFKIVEIAVRGQRMRETASGTGAMILRRLPPVKIQLDSCTVGEISPQRRTPSGPDPY